MSFAVRVSYYVYDSATGLPVTGKTAAGDYTTLKVCEDGTLGSDIKATATIVDDGAGNYGIAFTTAGDPVKEVKVVPVMATAGQVAVPSIIGAESLSVLAGTKRPVTLAAADVTGNLPTDANAVVTSLTYGNAAIKTELDSKSEPGDAMDLIDAPSATAISAIQSGLSTLTAQQVWEYATRTVSSFGSLVADIATAVWGAVARTLTASPGPSAADIRTEMDSNSTKLTAIDSKTTNLPASPAAVGSQMDLVDAPNATAITAIQLGLASAAELAKVKGASAGKYIINAAGTQVQLYDEAGNLLSTIDKTVDGGGIITWTPTWA